MNTGSLRERPTHSELRGSSSSPRRLRMSRRRWSLLTPSAGFSAPACLQGGRRVNTIASVVIGAAGYLGPPGSDGTVEIGYSIVPDFQAQGYATEIVQALVSRVWSVPAVHRVIAHTSPSNVGSIKVLERCGFKPSGRGGESGKLQYEKLRPAT